MVCCVNDDGVWVLLVLSVIDCWLVDGGKCGICGWCGVCLFVGVCGLVGCVDDYLVCLLICWGLIGSCCG